MRATFLSAKERKKQHYEFIDVSKGSVDGWGYQVTVERYGDTYTVRGTDDKEKFCDELQNLNFRQAASQAMTLRCDIESAIKADLQGSEV